MMRDVKPLLKTLFVHMCILCCNGQSLSNLVSTLPTQQATNSTVIVTVTASPPATATQRFWPIRWTLDGVIIGNALFDYNTNTTSASVINNTTFSRADINASFPIGPNNQFTSSVILRELQLNDSGKVISFDGDPSSGTPPPPLHFTLMVKDCPVNISSNITVESQSYIFDAQGTFKSLNNLTRCGATRCLASATWSGQDNVQCTASKVPRNVALAIPIAILVILVILVIVLVILVLRKRGFCTKKDGSTIFENPTFDSNANTDEKEEKVNPLYQTSMLPPQVDVKYSKVDKKKKNVFSEKEEKLNPLYAPSTQAEDVEAEYTQVDGKLTNEKGEKEMKENPLYVPSAEDEMIDDDTYAVVDEK